MGYISPAQTVAETPTFTKQADKIFSNEAKRDVIDFLAANSKAGDIIPGTGGVRKVRVPTSGRGKRGGARVVHFYYDESTPLFALAVYAKSQKADMTTDEKRKVTALVQILKRKARK